MMTRHGAGTFMHPIDIENLTVTFGERVLFDAFCLRVARGEKVMVSGPSGGGKTVLLRCILGLEIPRHGVVRIFGRELNAASVWDLRRHLAYVAQEPDLGAGTVREALERPFGFKANAALRDNLDRVPALMERFRLPSDLADESMHTLSGGEKQRVALISAILLERPIILLDEASAALDPDNRDTVIAYFRQAEDTTVLSVSHDREWEAFCSRSVRIGGCSGNATLQRGSENEDARLEPGAPTTGNATLQRGSENEDARLEPGAPTTGNATLQRGSENEDARLEPGAPAWIPS